LEDHVATIAITGVRAQARWEATNVVYGAKSLNRPVNLDNDVRAICK